MIAAAGPQNEAQFSRILRGDPLTGGRIAALAALPRASAPAGLYLAGDGGALSLQGRLALYCGQVPDPAELWEFLQFAGARSIESADRRACPPGWRVRELRALCRDPVCAPRLPDAALPPGVRIDRDPVLWKIRASGLIPERGRDAWYADTCARMVRGTARVFAAVLNGQIVSAASLYRNPGGCLLAGVATLSEHRGCGLASALTVGLVAEAGEQSVRLICGDSMLSFYRRFGFAEDGVIFSAESP